MTMEATHKLSQGSPEREKRDESWFARLGIAYPRTFREEGTNSISRVILWIIPTIPLAEWYPALCPPSLPLYGFIPQHRFSFMVMSHSMDVFVPMVMSSFTALSASINSRHDCTTKLFISRHPKTLRQLCLRNLRCFCLLQLCFILRSRLTLPAS